MQYPEHDINPNKKGRDWLLQYARAAWFNVGNGMPDIFYRAGSKYKIIKSYVLGKQDNKKYLLPYMDENGKSWANIDGTIRPVVCKLRDIAISKLQQRDFNITCTPIDPLAKDDADKYFANVKVKILMRDQLKKINPELATSPALQKETKEPEDLEELEMQMNYGWKHNMAIEAEEVFQLIAYQNGITEQRRQTITNLFDYGVGGYKEWINEKNEVQFRAVRPENIITSFCRKADFSDLTHVGEVIEVSDADLSDRFNAKEMEEIMSTARTDFSYQPNRGDVPKDRTKIAVLDLELITWDDRVIEKRVNRMGNLVSGKASYEDKFKPAKVVIDGKEEPKYVSKTIKNIYKVKWVIGTNYVYDYGMATGMKRESDLKKMAETCLSYHLYAYNFYEMRAQGIMERLIPILDEYQATIYRIQHFKNKWIPYIISLDLDALEDVALGQGGTKMDPLEVIDMLTQTNILVGRKKDQSAANVNYKSVEVLQTPMANEFAVLVNDLIRLVADLSSTMGLNELTDGTTPNAKTLVPVANMASESTNNALWPITFAEKSTLERLAKGVIQRVQTNVKNGVPVNGVVQSLGSNTVKFITASPDLALHVYGIMVEDKPTDAQKQALLEKLNMKDAQGLLDPEDYVMVMNCQNLKQAEQLLAYRVKKNKEKQQQDAMAMQQQNGQIQIQSAQAAEKAKQDTIQKQKEADIEVENVKGGWMFKIAELKTNSQVQMSENTHGTKILAQTMQHHVDERQAKIEQGIPVMPMDQQPEAEVPQEQNMEPSEEPVMQ